MGNHSKGNRRRDHIQNHKCPEPRYFGPDGPWRHADRGGAPTHANDIQDRKLVLRDPKSGKDHEIVFIPHKVADRLRNYARQKCKNPEDRIFPISYEASRVMVSKAVKDGWHSPTFASHSGVPIEIVSKVILRHANLSTQRYLGKISDLEAMKWTENLYG